MDSILTKPIKHAIAGNKKQMIHLLKDTVERLNMSIGSSSRRWGLISFHKRYNWLFYAYLVSKDSNTVRTTIAPGLTQFEAPEN
ncbi:MAG TPA: hypothetical protein VJ964_09745, partial [Balneolaceae bacterium]|nr:hypothetical protein [Balneolaceae bacterium]